MLKLGGRWQWRALAASLAGLVGLAPAALASSTDGRSLTDAGLARAEVAHYQAGLPAGLIDCIGPASNPAPGTPAWTVRDVENQFCATGRQVDELTNPAFQESFDTQTPGLFLGQSLAMLGEPGHLHLTLGQLTPGGTTADPFRTLAAWTAAGRGRVRPISFAASDGAQLNGYLFEPPARDGTGPYPGVVITTGSLQGYQQIYFWAAEGLAEAGYMVMTYDVQGQGDSDTLPASCAPSNCPGVPFQQNYNFYQGTEDALNFFFSTGATPYPNAKYISHAALSLLGQHLNPFNPDWSNLEDSEVGLAGHSLGAAAVSQVGQCDPRVRAIVAWDNLAPATACSPAGTAAVHTPALGINSEYFLNPEPMTSAPDPHAKDQAFHQLESAGVDTMQIALRDSTHLEYSFIPWILPASSLGERVAFYYTLAWFDYYLRHQSSGFQRLVATTFDGSADAHAIGAGGYSVAAALADPGNVAAGNVPHTIGGLPVDNRLSFYYESEYALSPPAADGAPSTEPKVTCGDMRAGCPAHPPSTP